MPGTLSDREISMRQRWLRASGYNCKCENWVGGLSLIRPRKTTRGNRSLAPRYHVQRSMTDSSYYWRCYESNATLAQNWEGDSWQSRRNDGLDLADQGDHN